MTVTIKREPLSREVDSDMDNSLPVALSDETSPPPPPPDLIFDQLHALVSPENHDLSITAVQVRASSLFARLKAVNRDANASVRDRKQLTSNARLEMDHMHLGLQNLQYEKRHLEREIEKCRQFASIYQDVPLHPIEEFQQLAPEEARSEDVMSNEHQLMLNRLSYELAERQRLDEKLKALTRRKEQLQKEGKAKLAKMDSVKSQIDQLMKAASDIQKKVDEIVQGAPATPAAKPG